jgi:hypothetical protein
LSAAKALAIIAGRKNISRFVLFFERNLNKGLIIITASHCILWHPAAYYGIPPHIMAPHSISSYPRNAGESQEVRWAGLLRPGPHLPPLVYITLPGDSCCCYCSCDSQALSLARWRWLGQVGAEPKLLLRDSGIQRASVKNLPSKKVPNSLS